MAWPHTPYLLGVEWLDAEHTELANIITEFASQIANGASGEAEAFLSRLIVHARRHFEREQERMDRDRYPLLEHHKGAHRRLLRYIELLISDLQAGRIALDLALINDLWDWENAHIATEDRMYAEHIQQKSAAKETAPS